MSREAAQYQQNMYHRNKKKAEADPTICPLCGKIKTDERCRWCYTCRRKQSTKRKRQVNRDRQALHMMYGNKCVCCGETEEMFLTLDHINNDGAEDRKTSNGKGNRDCLRKALRKYQPDTYQILCWNCNCGRSRNGGVCPHQEKSPESP